MSLATLPPTAQGAGDDFDDWERELSPTYRPTRAAMRREGQKQINAALGIRQHRAQDRAWNRDGRGGY